MKEKLEIRSVATPPAINENVIEGYAIVWNVESRVLWDFDGDFVEVIERGAVDDELIKSSDVKALFNHDPNALLARSVNGKGTLKLVADDYGLRFEFEKPNTTLGNDVAELIKRGDLQGCSFAFWAKPEDCEYTTRSDGSRLRTVKKLSLLADVSVVVEPAYVQTSVSARSFGAPEDVEENALLVEDAKRFLRIMFN